MKAIAYSRFGGPEVLQATEAEVPQPGPGQVRVRVHTAAVNALDGKVRSGALEAVFPTALPSIPGIEVAGVVDTLGKGVSGVRAGDAVLGFADTGSYAEYALSSSYAPKPGALPWEDAVTLPVAVETADRVLRMLQLTPGETLLIHGAAGGVGTLAIQLATFLGVNVIATAGPGNQEYLATLGATPTVYGPGLVERVRALAPDGVDAVLDVAGKDAVPASIELRGGTERIVTIADFAAQQYGITFAAGPQERSASRLTEVADLAARGKLLTTVAASYPLADAAAAQRVSDGGHVRGKLVLTVA
ncbi:NADP-dependent oxidoreductase [Microbispora bryophytorum subsp. camponoti]|uniref:NADP-dependent oxidoreductase n=2 Tax=Microbispora bryophytorum TaxID=1460882 RepID=A0ABR8KVL9_9ACTN|nr:NADP-dependent oxidoreductase [Microbispora camponoti]